MIIASFKGMSSPAVTAFALRFFLVLKTFLKVGNVVLKVIYGIFHSHIIFIRYRIVIGGEFKETATFSEFLTLLSVKAVTAGLDIPLNDAIIIASQ
jgi:hypothetical protein